jgi:hypothetical protein
MGQLRHLGHNRVCVTVLGNFVRMLRKFIDSERNCLRTASGSQGHSSGRTDGDTTYKVGYVERSVFITSSVGNSDGVEQVSIRSP